MKLKSFLCLFLCVASFAGLHAERLNFENYADANECCAYTDCCKDDCCPQFNVYADFLYWKVRRCDLDYAVPQVSDGVISRTRGKVKTLDPGYDVGYRLGWETHYDSFQLGLRYVNYTTKVSNSISGDLLMRTWKIDGYLEFIPEFAQGSYNLDYDVIDLEVSYDICSFDCLSSKIFSGVKIAYIDQKLKTEFGNTEDFTNNYGGGSSKVDIDAYGVYLGSEGTYTTCGCFGFYGRISYGLLVGDVSRKWKAFNVDNTGQITNLRDAKEECWEMLSNVNLSFGVNYEIKNCFCADWTAFVGYEFQYWYGLTDFLSSDFERNTYNLGLDGLFVRLMASF